LRSVLGANGNLGEVRSFRKRSERRKERNLQKFNFPHFHSTPCSLWKSLPASWTRVLHMPHVPRPPSVDHGVISLLWAIGLGAYIYYGSLAVGVSGGTAFIFAALGAFAIFVFVRVFGEQTPPRRYAVRRRNSQPRTSRD
jgi:hypothetical protein